MIFSKAGIRVWLAKGGFIGGLLLVFLPTPSWPQVSSSNERHVLMVSFDGFRADYAHKWQLENFLRLESEGASTTGLIPVYPSKTFPNHYTLVTGLYPGRHGLVDNAFFSPSLDATYTISNREAVENPSFYGGTPLWQHLSNNGIKTASFFWVGSEAPIQGKFPDYYQLYDGAIPDERRIEQVLDWLRLPDTERPRFITLYFSLVDSIAHDTGPESSQTMQTALQADSLLGLIMEGLSSLPMNVDLLVVSDHGMHPVLHERDNYVDLGQLNFDRDSGRMITTQTQAQYYLDPDKADQVDRIYEELKAQEENFTVYRKTETPAHWHYDKHDNIGDILIVTEPGFVLTQATALEFANPFRRQGETYGVHGYDAYQHPTLHGIFYAWGKSIKQGYALPAFESIHVFPLVTRLFGIDNPDDIDGDDSVLADILRD